MYCESYTLAKSFIRDFFENPSGFFNELVYLPLAFSEGASDALSSGLSRTSLFVYSTTAAEF